MLKHDVVVPGYVECLDFSPNAKHIATASHGSISIWNAETAQLEKSLNGSASWIAYSHDGSRLLSVEGMSIMVWNVGTGERQQKLENQVRTTCAIFSPDSSIIAAGSTDLIKIWAGPPYVVVKSFQQRMNMVRQSFLSPDVRCLAWSPDGLRIISGGNDGNVRIWEFATGKQLKVLSGHVGTVTCVACVHTDFLGSGGIDGTIRIWNSATGEEIKVIQGHTMRVTSIAFSPDGAKMVSGSWDKTVRLWNVATKQELQVWTGQEEVTSVAYASDGVTIVGAFGDRIKIWDARPPKPSPIQQLLDESKQYLSRLSAQSRQVVRQYTGFAHLQMNRCLRKGKKVLPECNDENLSVLDRIIANGPVSHTDMTVYRGFNPHSHQAEKLRISLEALSPGDIFEERAFMSTAYGGVFKEFVGSTCCVMEINVPAGVKMLAVESVSKVNDEREILLSPGMGLQFLGKETKNGLTVYLFQCKYCLPSQRYRQSKAPSVYLNVKNAKLPSLPPPLNNKRQEEEKRREEEKRQEEKRQEKQEQNTKIESSLLGCYLFTDNCMEKFQSTSGQLFTIPSPLKSELVYMMQALSKHFGQLVVYPVLREHSDLVYMIAGTVAMNYWIRALSHTKMPIIPTQDFDIKLREASSFAVLGQNIMVEAKKHQDELLAALQRKNKLAIAGLEFLWRDSRTLTASLQIPQFSEETGMDQFVFVIVDFDVAAGLDFEDNRILTPEGIYLATAEYVRDDSCKGWGQLHKSKRREAKMKYWNLVFPQGHRLHQPKPFNCKEMPSPIKPMQIVQIR